MKTLKFNKNKSKTKVDSSIKDKQAGKALSTVNAAFKKDLEALKSKQNYTKTYSQEFNQSLSPKRQLSKFVAEMLTKEAKQDLDKTYVFTLNSTDMRGVNAYLQCMRTAKSRARKQIQKQGFEPLEFVLNTLSIKEDLEEKGKFTITISSLTEKQKKISESKFLTLLTKQIKGE